MFPGDLNRHGKISSGAARHNNFDGDAIFRCAIARANRAAHCRASPRRSRSLRQAEAATKRRAAEARASGRSAQAGTAASARCSSSRRSAATPTERPAASPRCAAGGRSATASGTTGCTDATRPATGGGAVASCATGCRTRAEASGRARAQCGTRGRAAGKVRSRTRAACTGFRDPAWCYQNSALIDLNAPCCRDQDSARNAVGDSGCAARCNIHRPFRDTANADCARGTSDRARRGSQRRQDAVRGAEHTRAECGSRGPAECREPTGRPGRPGRPTAGCAGQRRNARWRAVRPPRTAHRQRAAAGGPAGGPGADPDCPGSGGTGATPPGRLPRPAA